MKRYLLSTTFAVVLSMMTHNSWAQGNEIDELAAQIDQNQVFSASNDMQDFTTVSKIEVPTNAGSTAVEENLTRDLDPVCNACNLIRLPDGDGLAGLGDELTDSPVMLGPPNTAVAQ